MRIPPTYPSLRHDLEGPVLDEEREVVEVMLDPAHLHDADVPAHGGAHADVDLPQPAVDDRVREEFLHTIVGEGGRVSRHLGHQERRRIQVPQFLKELEDLVPRALERREGVQGIEAVEGDQVASHLLLVPRELSPEAEEPPRLLPDFFDLAPQRADIDDVHALRLDRLHAEGGHLGDQGRPALLHGKVQPGGPALLRLVKQDTVDEGGLQGTGRACDQDDVPSRDASAETGVEPDDVGWNLVRGLGQPGNPSPDPDGRSDLPNVSGIIEFFVERLHRGAGAARERILKSARTLRPRSCPPRWSSAVSSATRGRARSSTSSRRTRTSSCVSREGRMPVTRSRSARTCTPSISFLPECCGSGPST